MTFNKRIPLNLTPMNKEETLTKESFLEAGFLLDESDPFTPFYFSLTKEEDNEDEDYTPAVLGFSPAYGSFCIVDPFGTTIHFNASTPKEAMEWASKITSFEPNF